MSNDDVDATQPRPPRDGHDDEAVQAAQAGLRCPYCHDALSGAVGHCAQCGTAHHMTCFADHMGCSTHGCGSTRATTAAPGTNEASFTPLACGICRDPLPRGAMVARCAGCGDALHVACYERLNACRTGATRCAGPVELMPHAEAAAIQLGQAGRGLLVAGLVSLALTLVVSLDEARSPSVVPLVLLLIIGAGGLGLTGSGLWLRWRARRLASAPARSASAVRGAKDDG